MSGLLRRLAPAALLAASAPWTFALVLVHRHAHEHEHENASPLAGIEWGLHGHEHDSGTPAHDHPALTERATVPGRLASVGLTLGSSAAPGLDAVGECRGHRGRLVARARNGPLRAAPTVSILRV